MRDNLEKAFFKNIRAVLNKNTRRVSNELLYALDYDTDVNTVRLYNSLYPVIEKNLRKIFQKI